MIRSLFASLVVRVEGKTTWIFQREAIVLVLAGGIFVLIGPSIVSVLWWWLGGWSVISLGPGFLWLCSRTGAFVTVKPEYVLVRRVIFGIPWRARKLRGSISVAGDYWDDLYGDGWSVDIVSEDDSEAPFEILTGWREEPVLKAVIEQALERRARAQAPTGEDTSGRRGLGLRPSSHLPNEISDSLASRRRA